MEEVRTPDARTRGRVCSDSDGARRKGVAGHRRDYHPFTWTLAGLRRVHVRDDSGRRTHVG
jgi:hypothetical protein